MKTSILLLSIMYGFVFSNQYLYSQNEIAKYSAGQFINDELVTGDLTSFMIDTFQNIFLEVDLTMLNTTIELDYSNRKLIRQYIDKYKEWARKCDSAKLTSNKVIGSITCKAMVYNSEGWNRCENAQYDFVFNSAKAPSGNVKCDLMLKIPDLVGSKNKFLKTKSKILWIDNKGCEQLLSAISEDLITTRNNNLKKQNELLK